MLDLMRKHARNWLMKVLLGIIIVVFIFYFGSIGGKQQAETIATINGKTIAYVDVAKEYQNLISYYRQRFGDNMNEAVLKQLNLKQVALDNLIQQAIILQKAKEMQLIVSDEEVKATILAMPGFRRGGSFDERIYQQALRYNKLTPEDFERMQKNALISSRFLSLLQDGVMVSDQDVYDLYRFENEKVNIRYAQVSPAAYRTRIKPSESDLASYLKEHGESFRLPDQIQLKYLLFRGADFAQAVKINEQDIADYYDQHRDRFKTKDGKPSALAEVKPKIMAELRQIGGMQLAADAAKKAHDVIYQNENFDSYASKNGSTVVGTGFFTAANPPRELAGISGGISSLVSLQKDDVSRVLSDEKAYYLFKVVAKKPAHTPALQEVRAQVEARWTDMEADRLARQDAEDILAKLKKGVAFSQLTTGKKLAVAETGLFLTGAEVPKLGASRELSTAIFQLTDKQPTPDRVFKMGGQYVIIQLKERAALDSSDFAAKKEALKKALLNARKNDTLQAWLEGTKAAMIKVGDLKIKKDIKDL